MSYISLSRRSLNDHHKMTVCITDSECAILLPYIQKAYDSEYKKWEKYNDMHESGEATSRQEDLRIKYSDSVEALDLLLCNMKERIKREEEEQL